MKASVFLRLFFVGVTLALASGDAPAASGDAPATSCTTCLQGNDRVTSFDQIHGWCYSTSSCVLLTASLFRTCPDLTIDAGTCVCRPDVYTDCASCASIKHLGCAWVSNATVTTNWTYQLPFVPLQSHASTFKYQHGRCASIQSVLPGAQTSHQGLTFPKVQVSVNVTTTTTPDQWYWAQCVITGVPFASLLLASLVCGCGLVCCCCCCHRRRTRRRRLLLLAEQREVLVAQGYVPYTVQAR